MTPTDTLPADIARFLVPGEPYLDDLAKAEPLVAKKITTSDRGCWEWTGSVFYHGYGRIQRRGKSYIAHRYVYKLLIGPIPEGLELDHLCRNRACCNPAHLRPVTRRENQLAPGSQSVSARNARKTHCKHGHEFSPENTIQRSDGGRRCRECARIRDAQRWPERRDAENARRAERSKR